MAPRPLSPADLRAVYDSVKAHGGIVRNAAAAEMKKSGMPISTFESRWRMCKRHAKNEGWPLDFVDWRPAVSEVVPITSYEQAWHEWQQFIGQRQNHYAGPAKGKPAKRSRVVIVGDLHVPFHDKAALAAMLQRERGAGLCVVNGDLQDFYSVSRFTKYEHVPFEDEVAQVQLVLEQLSATFPRVLIVEGNHDRPRFERQLRDRLPEEMVKVVEFLAGGNLSVIGAIAKRFKNVELSTHEVGNHKIGWFAQVGDLIVTHAEKFSRVPGSTLRGIDEWFSDMDRTLGLEPWRVAIQAHTHQLGFFPWHSDKLLVEGGCLCLTHGYQLTARIGGRPQRRGWVTLEQENGVTDLNSVRVTWWDAETRRAA